MSPIRLASLVVGLLSAGLLLGCPGTEAENPTSGSAGTGGVGGEGGAGGAGGMATSSSGTGGTPTCTDYSDVEETECKLLAQDCQGPNESCRPNGAGTGTVCEGGAGIKGVGATCSSASGECGIGLHCVFGYCSPICCQNEPGPFCGSAKCNVHNDYGNKRLWLCNFAKSCTLFDGKECENGFPCRLTVLEDELSLCVPLSPTPAPEGGACSDLNDCGANQRCVSNMCRYSCLNMGWQGLEPDAGGCPMGQTCKPETPTYGVCSP
ncbi:hypothetical protein [Polyangium sp. 6x1]|uniref:hypothetical protein n=1 Tax=Polyangium sp. 6x1 TaxID=3042689 RepID=UPI0024821158|nr:hypothetical protein [Polyangium sp. 6x1]MDI1444955.1 hypothetical protein [Polyangium sp. 6x1]